MSVLSLPPYPAGTVQQQCFQTYSYLFQMAQQLNLALDQLESGSVQTVPQQKPAALRDAATASQSAQYDTLKSLFVKTAETVNRTMEQLSATLTEDYVARSDFGTYVQKLSAYLEANPSALTQYYSFTSDLQSAVGAVDAAFNAYRTDTEGYIRTGVVYYEGGLPVYGVAVGQNLTATEVDGKKEVAPNNFRAIFTATKLSFWQDATEVAYISKNRLYITDITVLGSLRIGGWVMTDSGGMAIRWIGGSCETPFHTIPN